MLVEGTPKATVRQKECFKTTLSRQDPDAREKRYLEVLVRLQRPDGRVSQLDVEQRPIAGGASVVSSTAESIMVLLPQRSHHWLFSQLCN